MNLLIKFPSCSLVLGNGEAVLRGAVNCKRQNEEQFCHGQVTKGAGEAHLCHLSWWGEAGSFKAALHNTLDCLHSVGSRSDPNPAIAWWSYPFQLLMWASEAALRWENRLSLRCWSREETPSWSLWGLRAHSAVNSLGIWANGGDLQAHPLDHVGPRSSPLWKPGCHKGQKDQG